MDENSVEALLEAMAKYGVPNLQVAYFPGIDLYSHIAEAPLDIQQIYLEKLSIRRSDASSKFISAPACLTKHMFCSSPTTATRRY